jgi:type IV secretion system protein VirD4
MMFRFRPEQTTRWSTTRQLRKAGLFAPDGLILGRRGRRLLRHDGPEHVLVVASTQSGKTSNFVYPNLLTWRESVLIHDAKDELYPETAGWRGTFSRVVQLKPTSSTSACYNLLDGVDIGGDQMIRQTGLIAEGLTDPEGAGADHMSGTSKHFTDLATETLHGLMLYGLYTQRARSLGALNALLRRLDWKKVLRDMRAYPDEAIRGAAMVLGRIEDRELSGVLSTTSRALRLYGDPLIQRATDRSDFTLRDVRNRARPLSLYLSIPFGDQERMRPWSRLVIRQILNACVEEKVGWIWRVLGMIDEVPGLKRLNPLTDGLNYFAGYGLRLALITPSMEELIKTYEVHHNFLEGCKVQVIFGMHDARVAEIFSKRVGMAEVRKTRRTRRGSYTETVQEPLLSPTALINLPENRALVIVGRHKVLARKTYYKDHAVWTARSAM